MCEASASKENFKTIHNIVYQSHDCLRSLLWDPLQPMPWLLTSRLARASKTAAELRQQGCLLERWAGCDFQGVDVTSFHRCKKKEKKRLQTWVHTCLHVGVGPTWSWWLGPFPRSSGTVEGGDWWRWPMGVKAKELPWVCPRMVL